MDELIIPFSGNVIKLSDGTCWQVVEQTEETVVTPVDIVGKYDDCVACYAPPSSSSSSSGSSESSLSSSSMLSQPSCSFPLACCETGDFNAGFPEAGLCKNCGEQIYDQYGIREYSDGDIPSCAACIVPPPAPPTSPFLGIMTASLVSDCWWRAPLWIYSINGKWMEYATIKLNIPEHRWEFEITCFAPSYPSVVLWKGYKLCGCTPAGVYTWVEGCNPPPGSPSTINMEAVII